MKTLFLVKRTSEYGGYTLPKRSGLRNSVKFLVDALDKIPDSEALLEFCVDGNDIDRKLHAYKPEICFIEALWVTPLKLAELVRLHPRVQFVIRLHSKIPFLAMEGIAFMWMWEYLEIPNVSLSSNNELTSNDLNKIGLDNVFLPNVYRSVEVPKKTCRNPFKDYTYPKKDIYRMSCFGAIRPLKNQLIQAVAAIAYAESRGSILEFYINATRVEQMGEPVIKNLRGLFAGTKHKLIELEWFHHENFIEVLSDMDVALQVSFTETFNIVTADAVSVGVPVVVSEEVDWLPSTKIDTNSAESITRRIRYVLNHRKQEVYKNLRLLDHYNHKSLDIWKDYLNLN